MARNGEKRPLILRRLLSASLKAALLAFVIAFALLLARAFQSRTTAGGMTRLEPDNSWSVIE